MRHRTTVLLDDDVYRAARSLAATAGRSLGSVLSELARKGLRPSPPALDAVGGFPVFRVSEDAAPLTPELVAAALEDDPAGDRAATEEDRGEGPTPRARAPRSA
jgi:hypothetical protein